jgi:hypothetical protein
VAIVGPPSARAGHTTDLTNYGWEESCRLAESSRMFRRESKMISGSEDIVC